MKTAANGINLPGYNLVEQLYSGSRSLVYRAIPAMIEEREPPSTVIVKFMTADNPSDRDLLQFRHQYQITKNLDISGIVRPLRLVEHRQAYALVMEDFGGVSLSQYQSGQVLDCAEVLKIALQFADILHVLHQHRIIHKGIKPANILIHPTTKQVKLIDFGISSLLPSEAPEIFSPNLLEGTLAYISPEQTGRMNRGIDYRTDFYAMGVTLYELLTGILPFVTDDAMELIHCHIAQIAKPLHELPPHSSVVISRIVAKLMAKNAEDRYQSALGLKSDLENCLMQWERKGTIADFELGQRDLSDQFLIPEKLYGREVEVQSLLESFERVAKGNSEMMVVTGFSGIGKTAVINEVHKPITRQRGYFIKGKFDQFNRNIPLSAFLQALRDLIGQLWNESDTQLAIWKDKILTALGENGRVLVEIIPELEQIIGLQPSISVLSGIAAQNRFNLSFQKFIQVFTTADHPLVVFIDDLQWADFASLQLLQLLIQDGGHLLILGAYRDNEVWSAHPLLLTITELQKNGARVSTIELQPLNRGDINLLVADTLSCDRTLARPLTELVDRKTQGNPFFITQFLKSLYQDGFIQFNQSAGCWQCDLTQIKVQSLTDDVVELMARQLQKLEPTTQSILQLAACVGAQFDLQTLAMVSKLSTVDTATRLWSAIREGLVIPLDQIYKFFPVEPIDPQNWSAERLFSDSSCSYRFSHDRVQQAAYSLIPPSQNAAFHLQIGSRILKRSTMTERESNLFQIVNQLNFGLVLIQSPEKREELAHLNWQAGIKARSAAAYDAAMNYLDIGLQLLSPQCWQQQYTLSLQLHQLAAEVAYLSGDYIKMDILIQTGLKQAENHLDRAKFYETQILALIAQGQSKKAIEYAARILPNYGIQLPKHPTKIQITLGFFQTVYRMAGKTPQKLLALPQMTDPYKLAGLNLLTLLGGAAQRGMPEMLPFITFTGTFLSLRYGNSLKSPMGYIIYAFLLCEKLGRVEEGYAIGQAAIDLCHQMASKEALAPTLFLWNRFVSYRKESLRSTLPSLLVAYQVSLEVGNTEYAAYSLAAYLEKSYDIGNNLLDLKREVIAHRNTFSQLQQPSIANINNLLCQFLENLTVGADDIVTLTGHFFDETTIPTNDLQLQFYTALSKLNLALLFNRPAVSIEQLRIVARLPDCVEGTISQNKVGYYQAMLLLAQYPHQTKRQQATSLKQIQKICKQLTQLARHSPLNFQHQVFLLKAEIMRVLGRLHQAGEYYDQAIAATKTNGYIQAQALVNELAARFYFGCGKEKIATIYLHEAYDCYQIWGAKAKTDDLAHHYPQLLTSKNLATQSAITHEQALKSDFSNSLVKMDLSTLFKAAQAISSEIELPKLLATLLNITLVNLGADKVVLLLQTEQELQIAASLQAGEQPQISTTGRPWESGQDVAIRIVNSVKHSWEPIILANARDRGQFEGDQYLQRYQPHSILCSPILHQGKLLGIIYLENRLVRNVFTSDRLEVLTIICSQAAIALENARLFNGEQEKSQALTISLTQLQQSELRFQNLFEKSADAVLLMGKNGLIDCNEASVKLFGYSHKNQLSHLHPAQLSPVFQPKGQSSLEQANTYIAQAFDLGSHRFEWVHQRADGETFWAEVVLTPIIVAEEEVLHAIIRDIDDRKNAESKLEFTQFAVDNSADGIAWIRADGSFAYGNQAICQMLDYSFAEFCQIYVWDIDNSEMIAPSAWPAHWQHLKEIGEISVESEHHSKDGNYYPVELSLNYFEFAGEEYNFVQARNITERKRAEIDLKSTNQRLEISISDLLRATRLKDEFLATMSHELRTPLNAILGMSEALQEEVFGTVNDKQVKSLRTIERSGQHLLSLINDILDVSKISAGKLELDFQAADVADLCKSSLALIRQQAYNKQIQLDVHLPNNAGVILVDERRIRQALINLLSNAVKFTETGGKISLQITRQEAQVDQPGWLEFAVADTGIGITPADCDRLFEAFVQIDSRLSRQYEGTGLGLTLVKQIAELHGGNIQLKSVIGQGSCFIMHLPQACLVAASDSNEFNPFDSLDRSGVLEQLETNRLPVILLAEDNEANIATFSSYLTAVGYQIHVANNGQLAIELAQQEHFDLILMDIQMPEMDGIEAINHIRRKPQLNKIPIIALTALAMEGDKERCLAAGANEYLSKPIKLKQLNQTIQRWLDQN